MGILSNHSETTAAGESLRDFLKEGAPETPLGKNLWFCFQRRRAGFDWLLATHCQKLRPYDRQVMWWALTECYALKGLPAPIAVSVAIDEVKRTGSHGEASFVNAVLRSILREAPDDAALQALLKAKAPPAVQCELPMALYDRWSAVHGAGWVCALAALLQTPAPSTARKRGCFRGPQGGRPFPPDGVMHTSDTAFDAKLFYLQDPSTLMAPLMMNARPGERLADLCAAPGGKALILAERLDGRGALDCRDAIPKRLEQLHENLDGFSNVTIASGDAAHPALPPGSLDGVLLDVPCSNTGVIRRRPDVRWNFAVGALKNLLVQQSAILDGAATLLKHGGRLVYSTCSIEPEENVLQVASFLHRHPEFTLRAQHQLYPTPCHDGAYAAVIIRN